MKEKLFEERKTKDEEKMEKEELVRKSFKLLTQTYFAERSGDPMGCNEIDGKPYAGSADSERKELQRAGLIDLIPTPESQFQSFKYCITDRGKKLLEEIFNILEEYLK